ncbi:MAG: gliding motility-associated-like protein [Saprospiraceae bacterium]|jgi:gliding motility-associated-like protein
MKSILTHTIILWSVLLLRKGFECDGSVYLIGYTESTGRSELLVLSENNGSYTITSIGLSENRKLTSLAYNVLNKGLVALDACSYELVSIDALGVITSLGVPEDIDMDYEFHSGTISPDGIGIYLVGYDPKLGFDSRFYSINLNRQELYAGYLGITGDRTVVLSDIATDPISGEMFWYDNSRGQLVRAGIGGQISTQDFPTTGITNMSGLFFNQEGQLFGISVEQGIYSIDKLHGNMDFILESPMEATSGDACSFPFTSTFTKEVPKEILPCEEFEVVYTFDNKLGIGQTWISVRDTFPEGLEILSVSGEVISDFNIVDLAPNIVALENLIYLLHENYITVKVRASENFIGRFASRAYQWDFPKAFDVASYSDDPTTEVPHDETESNILRPESLEIDEFISFDCEGRQATISSPIKGDIYRWNTGSSDSVIIISAPGWYSIEVLNECIYFRDSIYIEEFPGSKRLTLQSSQHIQLGDSIFLISNLNRGTPIIYTWDFGNGEIVSCLDCPPIYHRPNESSTYKLTILDTDSCTTMASIDVTVDENRYFYAANAFSPNNDGVNDYFLLQSAIDGFINSIFIYNRWGNEVYSDYEVPINIEEEGWDGRRGTEVIESGVYIWMAETQYIDGFTITKSGTISIIHNQ